ncbi:MAG TPA: hypothetical protein VFX22_12535, partial [Candidatus Kapabacteria bacterium]|nr:hypothetical protein [Candidatus Kapabacteria bacterium]
FLFIIQSLFSGRSEKIKKTNSPPRRTLIKEIKKPRSNGKPARSSQFVVRNKYYYFTNSNREIAPFRFGSKNQKSISMRNHSLKPNGCKFHLFVATVGFGVTILFFFTLQFICDHE